ncbi:hypothetical protein IX325_001558 [Fusobacterium necrophorum subsp. funduliforme]|nr:hypothetical protein [Fusobacterium necrophorum subsp. funduliforme]
MAFLSFYTLKGFKLDYLLNLNLTEKMFMLATMELEVEKINKEVSR